MKTLLIALVVFVGGVQASFAAKKEPIQWNSIYNEGTETIIAYTEQGGHSITLQGSLQSAQMSVHFALEKITTFQLMCGGNREQVNNVISVPMINCLIHGRAVVVDHAGKKLVFRLSGSSKAIRSALNIDYKGHF